MASSKGNSFDVDCLTSKEPPDDIATGPDVVASVLVAGGVGEVIFFRVSVADKANGVTKLL